ncbi:MAG: hypothetical protein ABJG47_15140 [Ekhidna sp.]
MKLIIQICFILAITIGCSSEQRKTDTKNKAVEQVERARVFDYQPPIPVKGTLYAAIELGALGLNYFIAEIDAQKRWQLINASYGRSNIIYGVNTTREILDKIDEFRKEILTKGVARKNIHILASSSAVRADIISEIKSGLANDNLAINSIDAKTEAEYALIATIPKEFIGESFLVDIGSGNSKIAWVENDDTLNIEIHGSKYFLGDIQDTTVFREVRDALLEVPEKNRHLCFMLGGMIYEFMKDEIEDSENRYFVLGKPSTYPSDNEKLRAGNVIYNALYLEPTYSYIFDSESNFSIGFLLSLEE